MIAVACQAGVVSAANLKRRSTSRRGQQGLLGDDMNGSVHPSVNHQVWGQT